MSSSSRNNSMEPFHNSTRRPTSKRGRTAKSNTTMSTPRSSRQTTSAMNNDEMVCLCFRPPTEVMHQMASNAQGCTCTCDMDMGNNYMDISGIERMETNRTFEMNKSNRSKRGNKTTLKELEETMAEMQDDFEETILEVEDDPSNVIPLGRHYRINSFR